MGVWARMARARRKFLSASFPDLPVEQAKKASTALIKRIVRVIIFCAFN